MKTVLGRSQTSHDEAWIEARNHIEELISHDEVNDFSDTVVRRIERAADGKKVALAWSGGKDSIVLADLCERAGVKAGFFAHTNLDYPAFLLWCMDNKPEWVEAVNLGYDLDWLAEHEDLLFPQGKVLTTWRNINQIGPFADFYKSSGIDILLVGHRVIDGNVCGKDGWTVKKSGEVRYAPMYDMPHEYILGYLHYHGLELPPCYDWKNGWAIGTHIWPERPHCQSVMDGYREVYDIDPSIVVSAAEKLTTARQFLEGVTRRD